MAGRNPTAWRGALRRQAARAAGPGRGRSSRDAGSPIVPGPALPPGATRRRAHPAPPPGRAVRPWWSAAPAGCPAPRWREQRAVQPLVVGADPERLANNPVRLTPVPAFHARDGSAERRAHHQCFDPACVPSNTAQSARRKPPNKGPRTSCMASHRRRGAPRRPARRTGRRRSRPSRGGGGPILGGGAACRREPGPAHDGRRTTSNAPWPGPRNGPARAPATSPRAGPRPGGRPGTPELDGGRAMEGLRSAPDHDRAEHCHFDWGWGTPENGRHSPRRGGGGIRTLTGDGLSALPLPVGLRPRSSILDRRPDTPRRGCRPLLRPSARHGRDERAMLLQDRQLGVARRVDEPRPRPEDHGGAVPVLPWTPFTDAIV